MVTILETIANYAAFTKDSGVITEYVRAALARQITKEYTDSAGSISVITVDPEIETLVRESIYDDPVDGKQVNLDPQTYESIIEVFADAFNRAKGMGATPVFLVSPQIRGALFTMLERDIPSPVVLSYNEISKNAKVSVVASALFDRSRQ
jgi:flagellar biosynthesis protein FlhA